MKLKEFIELLGKVHSSNSPISEETKIDIRIQNKKVTFEDFEETIIDIDGLIETIDYDFKLDTLSILCKEVE